MSLLGKFTKKDMPKKQSFELPQSLIDLIDSYIEYANEKGIEIDKNELAVLCFNETFAKEKDFQNWHKTNIQKAN